MSFKLAIVGATGLVGRTMLKVLEERQIQFDELIPVASVKSRGVKLSVCGREYVVSAIVDNRWKDAHMALFSAGKGVSRKWIPEFVKEGVICIDNSSAFRQDIQVPLVVPEVNPHAYKSGDLVVAVPNCSTIQLVMVLEPLQRQFEIEKVIVSTYQSAAGVGQSGIGRLNEELKGESGGASPFPHLLAENVIPAIGRLTDSLSFLEEWKLIEETRKIMNLPKLRIFATAVRVPIPYCHAESVHIEFKKSVTPVDVRNLLAHAPGIMVVDDPSAGSYPLPRKCHNRDEVFVGRIRQAQDEIHTIDLWIVADNLRKGAATNAVQILQMMLAK
ncbi:MAG: aspartate-semialdehyde dehydrogenase [bacterium]|nr:aspartate-semialdehyde dehydrogenase [bacterium]